jgi:hypothetical protein
VVHGRRHQAGFVSHGVCVWLSTILYTLINGAKEMTEFAIVLAGASEWRYHISRVKFIDGKWIRSTA